MDAKLYYRVSIYNIISILAVVVFIGGFYLNSLALSGRGLLFLVLFFDDKDVNIIIFWPLLVSGAMVIANKYSMNKFINVSLSVHLKANNINVDYAPDSGSTKENEIFFPKIKKLPYGGRSSASFDMNKSGSFEDLGFSYAIDDYQSSATYKSGKDTRNIYNLKGQIYNFEYSHNLTNTPVIIGNKSFNQSVNFQGKSLMSSYFIPILEEFILTEDSGLIIYTKENYDLTKLYKLDLNKEIFKSSFYVIINNNKVSLFSEVDKFKIKVPFFISKSKLEELESNQKGNAYKFNSFLYDLAFTFKDLHE